MRPGPLTLLLLGAAIVAAFLRALYEQRARQLRRFEHLDDDGLPGRPGMPGSGPSAGEEARRTESRARLWKGLFYAFALGTLGAMMAGW